MERRKSIALTVLAIAAFLICFNWYVGIREEVQIDQKIDREVPLSEASQTYIVKPGDRFKEKYQTSYMRTRTLIPFVYKRDTIATSKKEISVERDKS